MDQNFSGSGFDERNARGGRVLEEEFGIRGIGRFLRSDHLSVHSFIREERD